MIRITSSAVLLLLFPTLVSAQLPLEVGDEAQDFELTALGDETVKLSDRFGEAGRVSVLLFSRASW